MRAKVRNFKIIPKNYDSRFGIHLEKEFTTAPVNIIFDENMYIEYPSDFEKELFNITESCIQKILDQNILYDIESRLNLLLNKYRDNKLLFLASDLYFREKEGMIILHKDEYFEEYE